MDSGTSIADLKLKIKAFCDERDWDQYHNAKELAIGIITESGELLDHFRFKSEKEIDAMFDNPKKREEIEEELADTFYFVMRLAQRYNIDITNARLCLVFALKKVIASGLEIFSIKPSEEMK